MSGASATADALTRAEQRLARFEFLARLPLLLTSSLDVRHVISVALRHLQQQLSAAAMSVFLREAQTNQLTFWSLEGEGSAALKGKKIDATAGIVGWVVGNGQSANVPDTSADPRFFSAIDAQSGFQTRSVLCVPLQTRGNSVFGAVEALNSKRAEGFTAEDLELLEHAAAQVSLAIENAQLYELSRRRAHQLAVLDRRKQDMLTVITHELRTPLNVIQSSAEMLLSPIPDGEMRERLGETLERGVTRLSDLVARLKSVTAVTQSNLVASPVPVDLAALLPDLLAQFAEIEPPRLIERELVIAPLLPPVLADPGLLTVALRNLIANAIRFTPDGGTVTVRAAIAGGLVEIAVSDTGIGIEEAQLPLIFEKFYEVGSAEQHSSGTYEFRSGGLGLGLAAVKAIAEAHNATVDVVSVPGKGSTFSICLRY